MFFLRIKIDVTKGLYNVILAEINQYIEITDGEDKTEADIFYSEQK